VGYDRTFITKNRDTEGSNGAHNTCGKRRSVSCHYRYARSQLQEGWTITSMGPSDFHLFGHLKRHVAGQLFATDADVK